MNILEDLGEDLVVKFIIGERVVEFMRDYTLLNWVIIGLFAMWLHRHLTKKSKTE